ncbi:hypothetical protein [Streptomyces sp. rh34]|uniref:hypothetical protein n=1 Tax=Streptomyces sp. rh34 TaxID=2034272 RepID=UPI000BF1C1D7|nr:hypothetical protein [Streptomyces sp. rh34]
MPILSGQIVTAGQLNRMQPRQFSAAATSALSASTTYALIPGCSLTLPSTVANATWTAVGVFDCSVTTTHTTNLMVGRLVVDTVAQTGLAIHAMDTLDRDTVAMLWSGTFAAAGSHALQLEGVINGAGGAGAFQVYTGFTVTVTEPV